MQRLVARPRNGAAIIGLALVAFGAAAVLLGDTAGRLIGVALGAGAVTAVIYLQAKVYGAVSAANRETRELWGLAGLLGPAQKAYPPPGGSALGANAISYLSREIAARSPSVIVELGPGASSILLSWMCAGIDLKVTLYGLEHHNGYLEWCEELLAYHDVQNYELLHAPFEHMALPGGWSGSWYATSAVEKLPPRIDLLIVDGPPNPPGADQRYPAFPVLQARLAPGALIVVDDTHRPAERKMITRWAESAPLGIVHDGGDFMVLRLQADDELSE